MVDFPGNGGGTGGGGGSDPAKPGWQTTEFWLSAASIVIGFLLTNLSLPEDSPISRALVLAATILTALGYSVSRSLTKRGLLEADTAKMEIQLQHQGTLEATRLEHKVALLQIEQNNREAS